MPLAGALSGNVVWQPVSAHVLLPGAPVFGAGSVGAPAARASARGARPVARVATIRSAREMRAMRTSRWEVGDVVTGRPAGASRAHSVPARQEPRTPNEPEARHFAPGDGSALRGLPAPRKSAWHAP